MDLFVSVVAKRSSQTFRRSRDWLIDDDGAAAGTQNSACLSQSKVDVTGVMNRGAVYQ